MNLTKREKRFILDACACSHCEYEIGLSNLRAKLSGDEKKDAFLLRAIDRYSADIAFVLKLANKVYDAEAE